MIFSPSPATTMVTNTRRQQANRRGGLWIGLDPLALLRAAEMWLMRGTGFQPVLGAQDTG
jgi:hypothetical protein